MTDKDRIRLAEAMGWRFHEGTIDKDHWCLSSPDYGYPDKYHSKWASPPGEDWQCENCGCVIIPDPFTDANDDYAVLEWAMDQGDEFVQKFTSVLVDMHPYSYQYKLGDNARAVLKVLDDD